MFENAGRKIKGLAVFNFIVWLASGIGAGIYSEDTEVLLVGILLGCFVGWLSSILLYGFGELCENVYKISGRGSHSENSSDDKVTSIDDTYENSDISCGEIKSWKCPKCGTMNLMRDTFCFTCFYSKDDDGDPSF